MVNRHEGHRERQHEYSLSRFKYRNGSQSRFACVFINRLRLAVWPVWLAAHPQTYCPTKILANFGRAYPQWRNPVNSNEMALAQSETKRRRTGRKSLAIRRTPANGASLVVGILLLVVGAFAVYWTLEIHARYTFSLQSPVRLHFEWPLVIARRTNSADAYAAQLDQRRPLSAYQQYTCLKFGAACRVALAIQRAENPEGKCETYHYNSDGTLDWGYFQINTIHLQRPGLNLRDLLDCRANIDFAYRLYSERQGFSAWSSFNNGTYRKFLRR
jgi:hypothetical protein